MVRPPWGDGCEQRSDEMCSQEDLKKGNVNQGITTKSWTLRMSPEDHQL